MTKQPNEKKTKRQTDKKKKRKKEDEKQKTKTKKRVLCCDVGQFRTLAMFLSRHHADQKSEGAQVSKVTLCVKILKCQSPTD